MSYSIVSYNITCYDIVASPKTQGALRKLQVPRGWAYFSRIEPFED